MGRSTPSGVQASLFEGVKGLWVLPLESASCRKMFKGLQKHVDGRKGADPGCVCGCPVPSLPDPGSASGMLIAIEIL